jgi:hypothetical protein
MKHLSRATHNRKPHISPLNPKSTARKTPSKTKINFPARKKAKPQTTPIPHF